MVMSVGVAGGFRLLLRLQTPRHNSERCRDCRKKCMTVDFEESSTLKVFRTRRVVADFDWRMHYDGALLTVGTTTPHSCAGRLGDEVGIDLRCEQTE
jgi:hypothetical protein